MGRWLPGMGPPTSSFKMKNEPITILLIAISIIVCIISSLGANTDIISGLFFSSSAIVHGQIWRLFTPMFIHFGVLHILFNSMAAWQLSRPIEHYHSRSIFICMVIVWSGISNIAQAVMVGPMFGGLSGLLYGMFGYLWIYGIRNPGASFWLSKNNIIIMLVWFGLCWTGLLGPVANWAHTGGLLSGIVWAYFATIQDCKPRQFNDPIKPFDDL